MDPFDELGSLRKQNRGQSNCPKCGKQYNNRSKPVKCTGLSCDAFLGGSFKPKVKEADAQLLTSTIASVRLNAAGIPVRVFVDLKENKVSRLQTSFYNIFLNYQRYLLQINKIHLDNYKLLKNVPRYVGTMSQVQPVFDAGTLPFRAKVRSAHFIDFQGGECQRLI